MEVDIDSAPGGWGDFSGHDNVERQQMIRGALHAALGAEVTQVGILLTYTPSELQAMTAA